MTGAERINVEKGECLVALKHFHRRDLACRTGQYELELVWSSHAVPLMILQKMQEAILDIRLVGRCSMAVHQCSLGFKFVSWRTYVGSKQMTSSRCQGFWKVHLDSGVLFIWGHHFQLQTSTSPFTPTLAWMAAVTLSPDPR